MLDFIMPGMSGLIMSQILDAPDQPILFVSGYSETDAVKRTALTHPCCPSPSGPKRLKRPSGRRWPPTAERSPVSRVDGAWFAQSSAR